MRVSDVLVGGKDDQELLNNLKSIFIALKGNGLRLKREKCVFLKDEVCYLGCKINKDNLNPIPEKTDAILNAPTQKNVTELKAFLGMLNYYHRFLDRLWAILELLHKLLRKGQSWGWDKAQQMPSEKAKQLWYVQSNDETFQEFEKIEINDNLQVPDSTVMPNQSNSPQTTEPTENTDNANSPSEEVWDNHQEFEADLNIYKTMCDQKVG